MLHVYYSIWTVGSGGLGGAEDVDDEPYATLYAESCGK